MAGTLITVAIVVAGGVFSMLLAVPGVMIRYGKVYGLILGYNTASADKKKEYDIEGLAQHIGNGLLTLAVLLAGGTAFAAFGQPGWSFGCMSLFAFVAMLTVIGGRRFMPNPAKPGDHRILKALLPERAFSAVRAGTKEWLMECSCGHLADMWEIGNVRYKAVGEPRQWTACEGCGKITWQKVRRKTPSEKKLVA